MKNDYVLADIGNSRIHLFDGQNVFHYDHDEALALYGDKCVYYICVNDRLEARLREFPSWRNVSHLMRLPGSYETMGVDRKALCLSRDNAVFIDAGSAITVDVMRRGIYEGGFLLPGLEAWRDAYARISPALDYALDTDVSLVRLPRTTKEQISYGIIASVKTLVERHTASLPLYVTGGDGEVVASFFKSAVYDETLVFKGMRYALQAEGIIKE
jgi:type III pantothenate kinase